MVQNLHSSVSNTHTSSNNTMQNKKQIRERESWISWCVLYSCRNSFFWRGVEGKTDIVGEKKEERAHFSSHVQKPVNFFVFFFLDRLDAAAARFGRAVACSRRTCAQ